MKEYIFGFSKKRRYLLMGGDFSIVVLAVLTSYCIRFFTADEPGELWAFMIERLRIYLFFVPCLHIMILYLFNQYNLDRSVIVFRSILMVFISVLVSGLSLSGILFFLPKYVFGRQVLLLHLLIVFGLLAVWRICIYTIYIKNKKPKQVALVGSVDVIDRFTKELPTLFRGDLILKHIYLTHGCKTLLSEENQNLIQYDSLMGLFKSKDFDILITDSTNGGFSNKETETILQLKYSGRAVYDLPTVYRSSTGKVPLNYVNGQWLLSNYAFQGKVNVVYLRFKRLFDFSFSLILIPMLSPLMLIIAILIKATSKGDVIFSQERLGLKKKMFNCYKFRTMVADAESETGPVCSTENDCRVTPLGRILRKTRLDELPQLFNILTGKMSFVGPRPIRECFALGISETVPYYWLRYDVIPGVTGWAQVNGAFAVPDGLKSFEYELFYIQNMSFFLDFITLLKTIQIVFLGKGKC